MSPQGVQGAWQDASSLRQRAWPREFRAPEPQVESSKPRVPASVGLSGRVESVVALQATDSEAKAGLEHAGAAPTR